MKKIYAMFVCAILALGLSACSTSNDPYNRNHNANLDNAVVTAKVKAKLHETDGLDSSNITVKTYNGNIVELTGTVKTKYQMTEAVSAARQVDGVRRVDNDLRIR